MSLSARFFDILLPDVLDFLDLETLLLSAMPISRGWRCVALERRTYWRRIALVSTDMAISGEMGPEQSLELFLLRLSRSGCRPIEVKIFWHDAPAVRDVLIHHLHHIFRLSVKVDDIHWDSILPALRSSAAPILQSLELGIDASASIISPSLRRDLFCGQAPVLSHVMLNDINFISLDIPECLTNVTSLHVGQHMKDVRLPDLSAHFPRLKTLCLRGDVRLDNPAFRREEPWRGLSFLCLLGRRSPASWNVLSFAMAHAPQASLADCDAAGVYALLRGLGSRAIADFPSTSSPAARIPPGFSVKFRAFDGIRSAHSGDVQMCLADRDRSRVVSPRLPAIMAFQDDAISNCIVELVLPVTSWKVLVGERYLTRFASLTRLVLTLGWEENVQWLQSLDATISCPRLERLVLRRFAKEPVVEAHEVIMFATRGLSDAPFPVVLELDAVTLHGTLDGFEDVFSSCVVPGTNDPR